MDSKRSGNSLANGNPSQNSNRATPHFEKTFDESKTTARRAADQGVNMLIQALEENLATASNEVVKL